MGRRQAALTSHPRGWNLFSLEPVSTRLAAKSTAGVSDVGSQGYWNHVFVEEEFWGCNYWGIKRAGKTVSNIEGAWIKEQKVQIKDGKIVGFRVNMNLTFVLDDW